MRGFSASVCVIVAGIATAASATPFIPGDVLVSGADNSGNFVKEFTKAGVLVQRINSGATGGLDLVVDRSANVQLLQGDFPTNLVEINPTTLASQTRSYAGLSTYGNLTYGSVGTFGNYVFVADNATANDGSPNGVVRFDLSGATSTVRFDSGVDPVDLTVGLDGLLYTLTRGNAINDGGTRVDVYNPQTLAFVRTVSLPDEQRGIAVDGNGDIYGVDAVGSVMIRRYSASGGLLDSVSTTAGSGDIDIAPDGTIVASSPNGSIFVTDRSLDAYTSFNSGSTSYGNFVAIAPEPASLAAVAAIGLVAGRRARRK